MLASRPFLNEVGSACANDDGIRLLRQVLFAQAPAQGILGILAMILPWKLGDFFDI